MKPDLIQWYLVPLLATPKGRMKRPRPDIRSTRKKDRNKTLPTLRRSEERRVADETTKTLLAHIKTTWCKVTTQEKQKTKAQIWEPWDQVMHIKSYACRLDKDQTTIREVGVGCGNPEKSHIFVEQMYAFYNTWLFSPSWFYMTISLYLKLKNNVHIVSNHIIHRGLHAPYFS